MSFITETFPTLCAEIYWHCHVSVCSELKLELTEATVSLHSIAYADSNTRVHIRHKHTFIHVQCNLDYLDPFGHDATWGYWMSEIVQA